MGNWLNIGKKIEGDFMSNLKEYFILTSILVSLSLSPSFGADIKGQQGEPQVEKKKHVLLIGASVGAHWNFGALPERIRKKDYFLEYIHGGGYNKTKRLREVLARKENKPDAVFIKECAAYFPGDLNHYKDLIKGWVKECWDSGIIPMLTTVVPVTRLHPFKQFMIDIVKRRNPLRFGNPFKSKRNLAIIEFNDWIWDFSRENGLTVLDLEGAVRYGTKNRYLREDLARIDGLHLNKKAYKILDEIVLPTLDHVNWDDSKIEEKK
jgi:hypothetical protein